MRMAECHPDRPHQAKGLCSLCYWKQYDDARRERRNAEKRKDPSEYKKRVVPPTRMADCHPDQQHYAVGLCQSCYQRNRRAAGPGNATCHPDRTALARGLCHKCYERERYWDDPEKYRAAQRATQAATRKRARDQLVAAYGGKCACPKCPETNSAFLCLDHVNGDGKAHRMKIGSHTYADLRRRGFPQEGFRLLCWNCNSATRFGQTCPHNES
jgi:hypothetical protein